MKRAPRPKQTEMEFPRRGGRRSRAGRKRVAPRSLVPHRTREQMKARHPLHVTMRIVEGVRSLRSPRSFNALLEVFKAGCDRNGFRLIEYSVQTNHVHLICEAEDRESLWRGIQGLSVRIVKTL